MQSCESSFHIMQIMVAPRVLGVVAISLLLAQNTAASTVEQRKAEFRQLVLDNYGDPEFFQGCNGFDDAWVGVSADENLPAQTCSGEDDPLKRDHSGTNFLYGRNAGPAVFAYEGMPIPEINLEILKCRALLEENSSSVRDFDLTIVVRMLFLAGENIAVVNDLEDFFQEQYDNGNLRLWITADEPQNFYWTENHMLLWLSTTHLLRDRINLRSNDDAVINVDSRLRHYLTTKIEFGYYEFFSSQYMPVTLGGLLNLVDFCSDAEIVDLAQQATTRLVQDYLRFTNTAGYFYAVAGRNKVHQYDAPYPFLSYLLTGVGPSVENDGWRTDFWMLYPVTSSFDFDAVVASGWEQEIDNVFTIGHPIEDHKTVHAELSRLDRIMFQFSAGAVIHPAVILDSLYFLTEVPAPALVGGGFLIDIAVWFLNFIPSFFITFVASLLPGQTKGTDNSGATYYVYKHFNTMLSSLQDFHVGYRAQEQFPWMATVHDIAVFTQSGVNGDCIVNTGQIANTHLPRVQQTSNVALITYKPTFDVRAPFRLLGWALGFSLRVVLYFPVDRFDEVVERGNWVIGRRVNSYVAVWRDNDKRKTCDDDELICDEYWYSDGDFHFKASAWAVVVGDSDTHDSFSNFVSIVKEGTVTKQTPFPFLGLFGAKVKTQVKVDNKEISSQL